MRRSTAALAIILSCSVSAHAAAPTLGQVYEATRDAAMEARDREALVEVAGAVIATDLQQAASDLRAAAQMPGPEPEELIARDATLDLARGLVYVGDRETATAVLRQELNKMLGCELPEEQHEVRNYAGWTAELAGAIAPLDRDAAQAGLAKVQEFIGSLQDEHLRGWAVRDLISAQARLEPGAALSRYAREFPSRPFPATLMLNAVETDPGAAMAHVAAIASGQLMSDGTDPLKVKFALAGAVMRDDLARGVMLARQLQIADFPHNDPEMTRPIGEAIADVGIGALPDDPTLDMLIVGGVIGLAQVDADAALALAGRVHDPMLTCNALSEIARLNVDGNPSVAHKAAVLMLNVMDESGQSPDAYCETAACATAPLDAELAAALLGRIETFRSFHPAFGALLASNRPFATGLIDRLAPDQQFMARTAMLMYAEEIGAQERMELAQALAQSGALATNLQAGNQLVREIAKFDPDLARSLWQALPALPLAEMPDRDIMDTIDAVLSVAEAHELRQPGSSGPETGCVESLMAQTPPDDWWPLLATAKLAGIFAYYDGPAAKAAAESAIGALSNPPRGCPDWDVLAVAIGALSRVDMRGTKALVMEWPQLRNDLGLLRQITTEIARRRPAFACEMVMDAASPAATEVMLSRILAVLGEEETPETAREFIDTWMALPDFDTAALAALVSGVLNSRSTGLINSLPGHLNTLEDGREVARVIEQVHASAMVFATDGFLSYLQRRLAGERKPSIRSAMSIISAAVAERRWEQGLPMIQALYADDRTEALLLIPAMREHRRIMQEVGAARWKAG